MTRPAFTIPIPVDAWNLNTPTGSEGEGYIALVGPSPTGAFSSHAGAIAQKRFGAWVFTAAANLKGVQFYNVAGDAYYRSNGSSMLADSALDVIVDDHETRISALESALAAVQALFQ